MPITKIILATLCAFFALCLPSDVSKLTEAGMTFKPVAAVKPLDAPKLSEAAQLGLIGVEAPKQAVGAPSGNSAKAWIYEHESGNIPCKINGGAVDCSYQGGLACGLGQALPCSKLTSVCSLSNYACQDEWFTQYMARYGSWEAAKSFWLANHYW